MIYNVLSGTLNPTQSINRSALNTNPYLEKECSSSMEDSGMAEVGWGEFCHSILVVTQEELNIWYRMATDETFSFAFISFTCITAFLQRKRRIIFWNSKFMQCTLQPLGQSWYSLLLNGMLRLATEFGQFSVVSSGIWQTASWNFT